MWSSVHVAVNDPRHHLFKTFFHKFTFYFVKIILLMNKQNCDFDITITVSN